MPRDLLAGIGQPQQGPRDLLAGAAPQQAPDDEGGFLSRLGNVVQQTVGAPVSLGQDIRDIYQQGVQPSEQFPFFRLPESIGQRAEDRSQAVRDVVPFAVGGPIGTLAGAGAGGLARRAAGAAIGAGTADIGQQVTGDAPFDPSRAAIAGGLGAVGQVGGELAGAAIPAAARRLLRGGEQGRQEVQQAIADAARFGETPTAAQATGRSWLDGIESLTSKAPGGSGRIRKVVDRTVKNVGDNLTRIAEAPTGGEVSAEISGRAIKRGVEDFVQSFQTRSRALYGRVAEVIGPERPVALSNTLKELDNLTKVDPAAPALSAGMRNPEFMTTRANTLNDLAKSISPNATADDLIAAGIDIGEQGRLPYQTLSNLRSDVGEQLSGSALLADRSTAQYKRLYAAMSKDLEAAAKAAGPGGERALTRANRFYRTGIERIEGTLEPLVRGRLQDRILTSLESSSREGSTQIRAVMKSLSPEQQDIVTGSIVKRLGRAVGSQQDDTGEAFSFQTFLTRYANLDKRARDALFKRGRNAQFGQDIDALSRYSNRVRQASQAFFNPSGTAGASIGQSFQLIGTGSVVTAPIFGTGMLIAPLVLGGFAGANNIAARMLTSPRIVRWMAEATRTKTNGIGAHLGRLSAIAAKEDPDVQEAIGGYLELLQTPISAAQAQPPAQEVQANVVPNAQSLPAQQLAGAGDAGMAALAPLIQGQQAAQEQQAAQNAQIMEALAGIQSGLGQQQAAPAAPAQPAGMSPDELALRQQELQMKSIDAANMLSAQQQATDRHTALMEQQLEVLRSFAASSPRPQQERKRGRKRATVRRDEFGRMIEALLEDAE